MVRAARRTFGELFERKDLEKKSILDMVPSFLGDMATQPYFITFL